MTINSRTGKSLFVGMGVLFSGSAVAALLLTKSPPPVAFETPARVVSTGTDPIVDVQPAGVVDLLKIENGNLLFARSTNGADSFEPGVRVNDIEGEVVSHPEATPRLSVRGKTPYVVWQRKSPGQESEVTEIRFARGAERGGGFENAITVDPSALPASQSFFNVGVSPKGVIYVAWIDGRDKGKGGDSSSLYLARSTDKGASFEKSIRVATGVCPCCRPAITFSREDTVHIGHRHVYEGSIRDIVVSTSRDVGNTWDEPVRVAQDNWKIEGCPHSGPSIASIGGRLFITWFTVDQKQDASVLRLASSDDGGKTFSRPELLSEGVVDANHPSLVPAGEKLLAVFAARDPNTNSGWGKLGAYFREIDASGHMSALQPIPNLQASACCTSVAYHAPGRIFLAWQESTNQGGGIVMARGRQVSTSMMARLRGLTGGSSRTDWAN
jgi:hypothetical protein